jgi:hypothetical protein
MLDGGTRLLGRVLPIGRGWRLGIVSLFTVAFLVGTVWFAGVQLAGEAQAFRELITVQAQRLMDLGSLLWPVAGERAGGSVRAAGHERAGRITSASQSGCWARSPVW